MKNLTAFRYVFANSLIVGGLLVGILLINQPIEVFARKAGGQTKADRLSQLIEANIIATHAYQTLLARKSGRNDLECYATGALTDAELEALERHQQSLLKSDPSAVRAWANGLRSTFEPGHDLEPLLAAHITVPDDAPVNVFTRYLQARTKAGPLKVRSIANLYQTVMEVERDGDRLQEEMAFYIALGLPVYVGQLGLPGTDEAMLEAGQQLAKQTCASPFSTGPAEWQIAGRKIWNWGEKNLHIRDEKVLARELLAEPEIKSLIPRIRALPPQKIAVIGHSFTMGLHWSSPSSFVPIVAEIFRQVNPKVEIKQFAAGGLTATRAQKNFYQDAISWKPDQVLLVVIMRTDEDYKALAEMAAGFSAARIKLTSFDRMNDSNTLNPTTADRAERAAREAGSTVIEVGDILAASPQKADFYCLDNIHMKEPYHRLMAKEWLKFLVGARQAKITHDKFSARVNGER